jgi:hypothetical protein
VVPIPVPPGRVDPREVVETIDVAEEFEVPADRLGPLVHEFGLERGERALPYCAPVGLGDSAIDGRMPSSARRNLSAGNHADAPTRQEPSVPVSIGLTSVMKRLGCGSELTARRVEVAANLEVNFFAQLTDRVRDPLILPMSLLNGSRRNWSPTEPTVAFQALSMQRNQVDIPGAYLFRVPAGRVSRRSAPPGRALVPRRHGCDASTKLTTRRVLGNTLLAGSIGQRTDRTSSPRSCWTC